QEGNCAAPGGFGRAGAAVADGDAVAAAVPGTGHRLGHHGDFSLERSDGRGLQGGVTFEYCDFGFHALGWRGGAATQRGNDERLRRRTGNFGFFNSPRPAVLERKGFNLNFIEASALETFL